MDELITELDKELPAGARVLDAGCGTGRLAAALTGRGHRVTAVDRDADAVAAARAAGVPAVHADVVEYGGDGDRGGFDAVVFRLSLHHIEALDRAVDAAAALLAPGGQLVVDEFAWDRADAATARWFFAAADLLVAAGAVPAERQHGLDLDPGERWRHGHSDLHTGTAMLAALGRRFPVEGARTGPYLHHYLGDWLAGGGRADAVRAELRRQELAGIAAGALAATGIRLVTRRTA